MSVEQRREDMRAAVDELMAGGPVDPYRIFGYKEGRFDRTILESYMESGFISSNEFKALMSVQVLVRRTHPQN